MNEYSEEIIAFFKLLASGRVACNSKKNTYIALYFGGFDTEQVISGARLCFEKDLITGADFGDDGVFITLTEKGDLLFNLIK